MNDEQTMPEEQAAELAALMHTAEEGAPVPGAAPVAEPEQKGPELAQEIAGAVLLAAGILRPAFPTATAPYTEEAANMVGTVIAELCNKYGWMQDGLMTKWRAEFAALAVLTPLGLQTADGFKHDMAVLRAKKIKAEPARVIDHGAAAADAAAPAPTVAFGDPVAA